MDIIYFIIDTIYREIAKPILHTELFQTESYAGWFSGVVTLITLIYLIDQNRNDQKRYQDSRMDNFLTLPTISKLHSDIGFNSSVTSKLNFEIVNSKNGEALTIQVKNILINRKIFTKVAPPQELIDALSLPLDTFFVYYNHPINGVLTTEITLNTTLFYCNKQYIEDEFKGIIFFTDIFNREFKLHFTFHFNSKTKSTNEDGTENKEYEIDGLAPLNQKVLFEI